MLTVSEMARRVRIGRSRFYSLIESGVFPEPLRREEDDRPYYTMEMAEKCLQIRSTGMGFNGKPYFFYKNNKTYGPKTKLCDRCDKLHTKDSKYCSLTCEAGFDTPEPATSVSLDKVRAMGLKKPPRVETICYTCGIENEHSYCFQEKTQCWKLKRPCLECLNNRSKEAYKKNPEKAAETYRRGRGAKRKILRKLSEGYLGAKCQLCDETEDLHFHHVNPKLKAFTIAEYLCKAKYGNRNPCLLDHPMLIKELDKCTLLCPNHHTKQHPAWNSCKNDPEITHD